MLGSELGGLIEQLPRGLIVMTCGAGILWLALLAYFAVIRPARVRKRSAVSASSISGGSMVPPTPQPYVPMPAEMPAAELPDLDLLVADDSDEPDFDVAVPAAPAPAAAAARRLGSADVLLDDGTLVHARETLLVLRDPRDGRVIVQTADRGSKTLNDAGARRTVEAVLRDVANLLKSDQPAAAAPAVAAPSPAPSPAPAAVAPPSPTGTGAMPGDLPRYADMKEEIISRGAFRAHKTEMPPIPELNIPAAIEAYLQYKKSFTPEYAQRSIHVLPAIGGGVRIEVDGSFYDGVSDVADPDVRAFLQATIAEWQQRQ